jgi:hypothetical protein
VIHDLAEDFVVRVIEFAAIDGEQTCFVKPFRQVLCCFVRYWHRNPAGVRQQSGMKKTRREIGEQQERFIFLRQQLDFGVCHPNAKLRQSASRNAVDVPECFEDLHVFRSRNVRVKQESPLDLQKAIQANDSTSLVAPQRVPSRNRS